MTLKWMAIVVAAMSATSCATANIVGVTNGRHIPVVVNLVVVATAACASVIAVVADLHDKMNGRISALTEFLVARLNELDDHAGDHNTGFVEGYLLSQGRDAAVVPLGPRLQGRRAMIGGED